ncbi:RHS repeat-associated core domain-containing protein [Streptomyces synnematoformans]|uniref:RHS repeat-associated core domain-containing protein n=1 Tax=Streptomyces synnematoformans TaxID=415721 RepID=A0ABP5JBT6_9ACTN
MRRAGRRRGSRTLIAAVSLAVLAPLTPLTPVVEAADRAEPLDRPEVPAQRASEVDEVDWLGAKKARSRVAEAAAANAAQAKQARAEQADAWPRPGRATVQLPAAGKAAVARAGGLPVTARLSGDAGHTPAGEARVEVLDRQAARQAGVTGVLLTVEGTGTTGPGEVRLGVDYSSFASMVGGGWAQRLELVQLPSCALTTPEEPQCRTRTALESDNNIVGQSVSAAVDLSHPASGDPAMRGQAADGPAVLAVTATAAAEESADGTGDYSATELSPSSSWEAGGSSGAFTWSYDFQVPPAAAGPEPELGLSYDSGSIDGRTATTNNQGTSVGEGFTFSESYIERSYGSCDDDGHDDIHDLCWKYHNAQLVLNGKSTRLVKDNDTGTWRLADDDASKVEHKTGAANGDNNGEYWAVTTGDGTRYVFGKHKLPGASDQRTNSAWTVPVFGDDAGEPGYGSGSSFAGRSVKQAWRWNLDYVVDTSGNAMTYWYAKETNHYRKNKADTANASYIRGGYLKRIEYGLRQGALFTDDADAKVTFDYAERCTATDCSSLTESTAKNWPDVPYDAICTAGESKEDCLAVGPSFFSRKRLTGTNTSSWDAASSAFKAVDSWKLTQDYLDGGDIGDSSDHTLVLKSIIRTGKAGTDITVNPVKFTYHMRPNRVDATDDILPLTRPRLNTITTETGAITTVTLSSTECRRSEVIDAPEDMNTRNCYPQYWNINGAEEASVDWFHKYRVLAVTESDPTGLGETMEYAYAYSGAAWHHNDDPLTPKDERTWSDWRGYRKVTSYKGAQETTRSKGVSLYLQGMHGDKKADGTTRSVSVPALANPDLGIGAITDRDQFAGQLRQEVTYDGSSPISSTVHGKWSKETARQDVPGASDHVARYVRTQKETSYTHLTAAGTWRERAVSTTFDDYGMPVKVNDTGEVGKGGDQTCTRTWYARNPAVGLLGLESRTRTVARPCSVADADLDLPADASRRGDVLSDTATAYDGLAWSSSMKPAKGLRTWTGRAKAYSGTTPSWQKTSATEYDTLGRPTSVTDNQGNAATTSYTPADAGPLTRTDEHNPAGHRTISFLDARRGLPLRVYDANNEKTETAYDALGRVTKVWLPNLPSCCEKPNYKFAYHLSNTKPSWVSTGTLKKDRQSHLTSYAIYDALLRPLQTQTPTPQGGRLLTDTRYDTRGLAYESYADIFDTSSTPSGTYTRTAYGEAPKQAETIYDGAERETTSTLYSFGREKWSTHTSYTGDSTATTALEGGSATRTITDVFGRTTETRDYEGTAPADAQYGPGPSAPYASTRFTHTLDDLPSKITGPDGAVWSYGYDLHGRGISSTDPDKGTTTTVYDSLDRPTKITDARGETLLAAYDTLGRPTGTWTGSKTDANQLTAYAYDTLLKGLPTASTRYIGGKTGQAYTREITEYDSMSRPVRTELRLPADDPFVQAGAPDTYEHRAHYRYDGSQSSATEPFMNRGVEQEIVSFDTNDFGQLTGIGGNTGYLLDADYSALGQPLQYTLGTSTVAGHKQTYVTNTYDEATDRLTRSHVTDSTHPWMLQDVNYTYDDAGNVTSISDPTTLGGTSAADTQCFTYDGHRRLTDAWTPASQDCGGVPDGTSLGGPAPYYTSYTYNDAGQRTTETQHTSAGSNLTTYCYTGSQPHTLTGTSTDDDCASPDATYTYDKTGNTTTRPGSASQQQLAWSPEGQLSTLTEGDTVTDYLYDADGELLIRDTEGGERVLYAGASELHLTSEGKLWAQRYYTHGGLTVAMRTNQRTDDLTSDLRYLAADHHHTSTLAITSGTNDTDQQFTKRYTTPFGDTRGQPAGIAGPWPDDKTFLGKTHDTTTGLIHVGAREYDPGTGQFLSADPLLEIDKPQTLNGYSYAANNPLTYSDPSGEGLACGQPGMPACPHRPDGSRGNGRPNEAVDYSKPKPHHPCNSNCGGTHRGSSGGGGGGGNAGGGAYGGPAPDPGPPPPVDENTGGGRTGAGSGGGSLLDIIASGVSLLADALAPDFQAALKCLQSLGLSAGDCANAGLDLPQAKGAKTAKDFADGAKKGGKAATRCTRDSFTAGTEVLMADGTTKAIEDIQPGDEVLATNPETGDTQPKTVTATIITKDDKQYVDLVTATDDGSHTLTTTDHHPFWSESNGTWTDAGDLTPGTTLRTDDGTTTHVQGVRKYASHHTTYNLTVANTHTYYVLAGNTPVLVHNSNCGDLGENWKPAKTSTICGSTGCEDVARKIQSQIGGTRYRITDSYGAPSLGKYRGEDTMWAHHDVVIRDGRVYDAWTSRYGEPLDQYRSRFEYGDDLRFDPLD